jgi:IS30 family transposase
VKPHLARLTLARKIAAVTLLVWKKVPRGTDLAPITQAQLDQVSLRLNQRPRKTLGFQTPASKLQASVASTG